MAKRKKDEKVEVPDGCWALVIGRCVVVDLLGRRVRPDGHALVPEATAEAAPNHLKRACDSDRCPVCGEEFLRDAAVHVDACDEGRRHAEG